MSILHDIYDSQYSPDEALKEIPSSLQLKKREFLNAVEEGLGPEFIEQHWEGLCQLENFEGYTNFREGFRLGVSLMLELL